MCVCRMSLNLHVRTSSSVPIVMRMDYRSTRASNKFPHSRFLSCLSSTLRFCSLVQRSFRSHIPQIVYHVQIEPRSNSSLIFVQNSRSPEEPPLDHHTSWVPPAGCLSPINPSACRAPRWFQRWCNPVLPGQVLGANYITSSPATDSDRSIYSERGIITAGSTAKFFQQYASRNRYRRMRLEDLDDTAKLWRQKMNSGLNR